MLERTVLVLNQNYEPLSVCSVRRALLLILRGKAEAVEKMGEVIHSVSQDYPVPSVVRLGRYIRAPRRRVVLSKRNILKRDNHQCQYCGSKDGKLTVDHIVPRTKGGPRDLGKTSSAPVPYATTKKANTRPEQVGLALRAKPKRPNNVSFIRNFVGIGDQRWKPYLFID